MDILSDLRELLLIGLPGSGSLTPEGSSMRSTSDDTVSDSNFDLEPENLGDILSRDANMMKAPDRSFSFYNTWEDNNTPVQTAVSQGGSTSDIICISGASCGASIADTVVDSLELPPQATASEPVGILEPIADQGETRPYQCQ